MRRFQLYALNGTGQKKELHFGPQLESRAVTKKEADEARKSGIPFTNPEQFNDTKRHSQETSARNAAIMMVADLAGLFGDGKLKMNVIESSQNTSITYTYLTCQHKGVELDISPVSYSARWGWEGGQLVEGLKGQLEFEAHPLSHPTL